MDDTLQFKCLTDLREIINQIDGYVARPTLRGEHPTLYSEPGEGRFRTVMGIRICDYKFSQDEQWVLPDDQMGLSFSSTWQNLKGVYKMVSRGKRKPVDVYWVLSKSDIPDGLAFVQDRKPKKKGHYFLAVTREMKVSSLVEKLRWVADRMSVIRDSELAS
ncbi:hypothetical protein M3P05_19860 [Sansalvadorimonas sp. 2012CJ34-2]|uniref:Uncharacterized protein n=1 Tax=Parendozoicomonas callyspongiae TaxID=2942213 RepID=A0ABT0PLB0_9GAMM|nr:hypothetical protein [Sansalvadorimonas sp. 2012CJ34-2]MCL6272180.1 hypothetical protein [Sansalvadorimonas sp. 2012CJ34-2]